MAEDGKKTGDRDEDERSRGQYGGLEGGIGPGGGSGFEEVVRPARPEADKVERPGKRPEADKVERPEANGVERPGKRGD